MITLFTTTKDFYGRNRINQLNAIRSWLSAACKPEVIIFGRNEGVEEIGNLPHLKIVAQVKTSETGAPYANEMFDVVSKIAKNKLCCYVNADILLTDRFFEVISEVNNIVQKNFLLVGQRIDIDVNEEIDFSSCWGNNFLDKYTSEFKTHSPTGSDYFVYPKGQYEFNNMSELLIGRPGWDLWMIYNARKRKLKTIDLSFSVCPYHLNHDYSHIAGPRKSLIEDEEALLNLKEIPEPHKTRFTLTACNYIYKDLVLKKSYSRDALNDYVIIEKALGHYNLFTAADRIIYSFRQRLENNIFLKLLRAPKRKFNIGAAKFGYENYWLHTDKAFLDITKAEEWKTFLKFLKLDNIVAEHVWEHLAENDTEAANKNCFHFLKRGGTLRIAVPDGYNPDEKYKENVRPGGSGYGADDHKILYNCNSMKAKLEKAGFKVKLLEYWDEQGVFHFTDWTDEGGRIRRSKRYDPRNSNGELNYTSLIVDAIKP